MFYLLMYTGLRLTLMLECTLSQRMDSKAVDSLLRNLQIYSFLYILHDIIQQARSYHEARRGRL
jgi:hypothetical protein